MRFVNYYLLFFSITIKMTSIAQNSICPMVVEGRTWNVVYLNPAEDPKTASTPNYYKDIHGHWGTGTPNKFVLQGDTVINGMTYKKLYIDGELVSGLREDDACVYACYRGDSSEQLIFDFSLQLDGIFTDEVNDRNQMQVKQVSEVVINGKSLRFMEMWGYREELKTIDGLVDYWIEGIGCMNGPNFPFWWTATNGKECLLLSCYDGDECIFNIDNFKNIFTSVRDIHESGQGCSNSSYEQIYSLHGHRLTAKSLKGISIIRQNNGTLKKVIVK